MFSNTIVNFFIITINNGQANNQYWGVVVAQLVERSLLIPEVRGSNPVIGKYLLIEHLFSVNCIKKTKIKKNEAGNGPVF